jgi:hypothetical protein
MAAPGWVRISDPKSNGGEPVTVGFVNLAQASGIGVHVENGRRVIKARFPDGSERTLAAEFESDGPALETLVELVGRIPR